MFEEAFTPARWSLSWVETKLAELKQLNEAFYGPAQIKFEIEPKQGQPEVCQMFARGPRGIPINMFRLVVEALMHGKNAFDQAAWAANRLLEPTASQKRGRYYPWATDEAHCRTRLESDKEGFDQRLHSTLLAFGYFDFEHAATFEQGLVRELSSIANRKHDVGISILALATPPSQKITGPGLVRFPIEAQWDIENGELLLAEWHESTPAPEPTTGINIRPRFVELLNGVVVGPIKALELYTREAKKVIETLIAEVGSAGT